MRKPFFKKSHNCWYVRDASGRDIRLDPVERKAFDMWHELAAALERSGVNATMLGVCQAFLDEHEDLRNYANVERYAVSFCQWYSGRVEDLTKKDVYEWLDAPKPGRLRKDGSRGPDRTWAAHSRRDAASTIRRITRWAHGEGLIGRNPLHSLTVSQPEPRSTIITKAQHESMVRYCMEGKEPGFAAVLIALRCGARPQQIRMVKVENCIGAAWVFRDHKTRKKTAKPLVVYLPPCLLTLSKLLCDRYGEGFLFRNSKGEPWKKDTIGQRFERMRSKLGLPEGIVAYSYRHTFATEALAAGLHATSVAQLLGHKDTRMVTQTYGHLEKVDSYLSEEAAKVARNRHSK